MHNKQSGMTLIEVLVSMAMLGALVVLYAAVFNISVFTKGMKKENIAYHIASKKMEELRNTPYGSLPTSATFSDTQLSQLPASSASFTINNYGSYSGLKEIVVAVNWNDGKARNISVKTLVGTGGINP
jgi:prepilin-type N-terminal cleavage/methylation domain-containing protein